MRFVYGSSLFGDRIGCFINYPLEGSTAVFKRSNYHLLPWLPEDESDVTALYSDVKFDLPGSFSYFFTLEEDTQQALSITGCGKNSSSPNASSTDSTVARTQVDSFKCQSNIKNESTFCPGAAVGIINTQVDANVLGSGFILVDPLIPVTPQLKLDLNAIQCQTVISKLLGPLEEWKDRLIVAPQSGYNVIHFTPVQELGESNSAYCIKDHFKLNPAFAGNTESSFQELAKFIDFMQNQWSVLSVTDVVLNHTANETPWLLENPQVSYNLVNSPHLKGPFIFDRALYQVTIDICSGKVAFPKEITSEADICTLRQVFHSYVGPLKLHEFYLFHLDDVIAQVEKQLTSGEIGPSKQNQPSAAVLSSSPSSTSPSPAPASSSSSSSSKQPETSFSLDELREKVSIHQPPNVKRFGCKVDLENVLNCILPSDFDRTKSEQIAKIINEIRKVLLFTVDKVTSEISGHVNDGIENVLKGIRYEWLEGKVKKEINRKSPLAMEYFTYPKSSSQESLEFVERTLEDDCIASLCMAHNGWIMNWDPLKNFADANFNCYLRREIISWGDSCKLRYGNDESDCPILWKLMKEYVEQTAKYFHGIRLDNCHATPIHVASYMIDAARAVRPNLYVFAELFTTSEFADNIFINHLGINSLIRESLACHDSHELGRLIHRFGGEPVGAFVKTDLSPLRPSPAHAIFFDQTHDNESLVVKRTPYDLLASAALICMSGSATGSNRGYDEVVPHHIDVVDETRPYSIWSEDESVPASVNYSTGIIFAKSLLNKLHGKLALEGFGEIFVDQVDANVVAITRFNPLTHESIVLVARTCFNYQDPKITGFIRNIEIAGEIKNILFEGRMAGKVAPFEKDKRFINGLEHFYGDLVGGSFSVNKSSLVTVTTNHLPCGSTVNYVKFDRFTPSSVIAFAVSLTPEQSVASENIRSLLTQLPQLMKSIDKLSLSQVNYLLFKCESEEKDFAPASGVYNIPDFGNFVYAGLAGLMIHWKSIRTNDDLGHPICANLRNGDWLLEYSAARFDRVKAAQPLSSWLKLALKEMKIIPRYLVPRYFDIIITPLYKLLIDHILNCMSEFVANGCKLTQLLAIASVALVGETNSQLPPLSRKVVEDEEDNSSGRSKYSSEMSSLGTSVTIAAGLPHFATGYMRNWGRDTFISLRGILLVTGRFIEARNIILGFAGTLRHGLIPNLLDGGINARYNCRDAVWYWLQSIVDYCTINLNDKNNLLQLPVRRLYPTDDSEPLIHQSNSVEMPLHQVMFEAISRHFNGIDFVERNAGKKIDEHMTQEGFNVTAGVDKNTGFIFGGNKFNCGTWMDKMGSSVKAGTKGVPATPRDGSAVELIGLSWSVLSWLDKLSHESSDIWPYTGVTDESGNLFWSWKDWCNRIKDNFEVNFWISSECNNANVNRREIYKDTLDSCDEWRDFQFRPNFLVAMAVAPDLFNPCNARCALQVAEKILMSQLGMKTLDPR